jgi:hypothetical protein
MEEKILSNSQSSYLSCGFVKKKYTNVQMYKKHNKMLSFIIRMIGLQNSPRAHGEGRGEVAPEP